MADLTPEERARFEELRARREGAPQAAAQAPADTPASSDDPQRMYGVFRHYVDETTGAVKDPTNSPSVETLEWMRNKLNTAGGTLPEVYDPRGISEQPVGEMLGYEISPRDIASTVPELLLSTYGANLAAKGTQKLLSPLINTASGYRHITKPASAVAEGIAATAGAAPPAMGWNAITSLGGEIADAYTGTGPYRDPNQGPLDAGGRIMESAINAGASAMGQEALAQPLNMAGRVAVSAARKPIKNIAKWFGIEDIPDKSFDYFGQGKKSYSDLDKESGARFAYNPTRADKDYVDNLGANIYERLATGELGITANMYLSEVDPRDAVTALTKQRFFSNLDNVDQLYDRLLADVGTGTIDEGVFRPVKGGLIEKSEGLVSSISRKERELMLNAKFKQGKRVPVWEEGAGPLGDDVTKTVDSILGENRQWQDKTRQILKSNGADETLNKLVAEAVKEGGDSRFAQIRNAKIKLQDEATSAYRLSQASGDMGTSRSAEAAKKAAAYLRSVEESVAKAIDPDLGQTYVQNNTDIFLRNIVKDGIADMVVQARSNLQDKFGALADPMHHALQGQLASAQSSKLDRAKLSAYKALGFDSETMDSALRRLEMVNAQKYGDPMIGPPAYGPLTPKISDVKTTFGATKDIYGSQFQGEFLPSLWEGSKLPFEVVPHPIKSLRSAGELYRNKDAVIGSIARGVIASGQMLSDSEITELEATKEGIALRDTLLRLGKNNPELMQKLSESGFITDPAQGDEIKGRLKEQLDKPGADKRQILKSFETVREGFIP